MIFVPLPFVVAVVLLVLLAAMLRSQEESGGNRPFLALIALCALQSIIVGLRWGYGVVELRYVLPVVASCLPPLVLASFSSLIHHDEGNSFHARWLHAAPPFGILLLLLLAPGLIDAALVVLFVGYALAILRLGRTGPDSLDEARLDGAVPAHRALVLAAVSLCLSACFDLAVLLDFAWGKGANAALIASNANLLGLLLFGLTAIVAARAKALPGAPADTAQALPTVAQDREILGRVDRLLVEQKLFRDENLTLARLARRAGVPARQISGAINRLARKNVSQYINDRRIGEACRLLRETDMSVTAAMFEFRVPDEIEFQSRIPTGDFAEPSLMAREKQVVATGRGLIARNSPRRTANPQSGLHAALRADTQRWRQANHLRSQLEVSAANRPGDRLEATSVAGPHRHGNLLHGERLTCASRTRAIFPKNTCCQTLVVGSVKSQAWTWHRFLRRGQKGETLGEPARDHGA